MKCPTCHTDNRQDADFCNECGAKLEAVCSRCGRANRAGSKFCDKCGGQITEAPSIDYTRPQSYTPKFLADKILTARGAIEGERKLVTVLFADVANYTSMSEKLDPEEVHQIMDGCFKVLMDEIHRYEGTIDKFTGDGVMALFGAPVAHEDHAQRACYAALAIQKAMQGYGDKVQKECGVEFRMRVGLDSGQVIVGSVGSDLKMDYTAIGDPVNLASRMESMTEPGSILVSGDTQRLARDYFRFKPLGSVDVKGKEAAVEAYELTEPTGIETRIGAAVARGLTRFVGRQREIGALKEAFEKAKAGSGQVVGVVGEAGVGKSRLLIELREALRREDYTYLEGRCLHYGGSMAYLPLLDVTRAYFDIQHDDREFVIKKKMADRVAELDESLKRVLPPLQDILSLKVDDEDYLKLDPPLRRMKTFEALRDLLIRESQERPLVLAVEDLHWIDSTTEEFLDYLIGFLPHACILLLLLYRPEYTHQWASKSFYTGLNIDQLSGKTSAELVQSILEGGEVAPELRELIIGRAGGNPLFVEEFTHTLLENGSIEKRDHQYVLGAKQSDIQVPDTIQGVIAARMDRLEENLKRTMQVASVIGRDFAYRILHTISGTGEELKAHLLNLQGLEFIYEKSLFPELEYIFKHALTQEVAYESLLQKRRRELHEKIGAAIEELYPDRLEEFYEMLAHHYSRSENLEKAYQYLSLSSVKTGSRNALWESARLGMEAIDVLKRMPDTDENKRRGIEIRLMLSGPLAAHGFPGDALQVMEEGAELAEQLGDSSSLANLWGTVGMGCWVKGDVLQACEFAEKAFRAAQESGDVELVATNGWELCVARVTTGEVSRVVEVAPGVLDALEKANLQRRWDVGKYYNHNLYSSILAFYGRALGMLGDFRKGQISCEAACRLAEDVGNVYSLQVVELQYAHLLLVKGEAEETMQHSEKHASYCEGSDALIQMWISPTYLGYAHYLLGDLDTAQRHFEQRNEIYRTTAFSPFMSLNHYGLGVVCLDRGDLEGARRHMEESLEFARRCGERAHEGHSTIALGRVLGRAEPAQSAEAEQYILQGITMLEELKLRPWLAEGYLFLGELYADTGQKERALEALKKAEAEFKDMGMDYWLKKTQEVLARVEG
jgi:class 3 adenylate cyclase/tetratricopeptide (TPR) repeat protein